jgi:hypothetical protein
MSYKLKNIICLWACCFVGLNLQAQEQIVDSTLTEEADTDVGIFPKRVNKTLQSLSVSGYYRFITNYRDMKESYPEMTNTRNIFVGDDAQIPQLSLNISGRVSDRTSFGTDLFMWTPMTGAGQAENVKGLNLGVNLYGSFNTDFGSFNVRTGGIHWYELSSFTFQTNRGYNRFSLFERNPWDPVTKTIDGRYNDFFSSGALNQDRRWGMQAFQGIIVDGASLPHDFYGSLMYGKTQLSGGAQPNPNNTFGGKIGKKFKGNTVALNAFNNITYSDSTQKNRIGINVLTGEFNFKHSKFQLSGEIGAGRYYANDSSKNNWGEAISVKLNLPKLSKKHSTEIHYYRISPRVLNNNGAFINTSVSEAPSYLNNAGNTQAVIVAPNSTMNAVGQMVNNRQGVEVNTDLNFDKLKLSIGYSASAEIDDLSNRINYSHPINNIARSRFWRWAFPANVGPYQNLNKIYRGVYETVALLEVDPTTNLPLEKKFYNSLELHAKYKTRLFDKNLYIFYLGQFNSAQNKFKPITDFSDQALLRTYYHQLESYYRINKYLLWCNYVGFERIVASYRTELDIVTGKPKNQTGWGLATGFDIDLGKNSGLYLRQRWMNYEDSSFGLDRFKGFETTAEVKIFF